MNMESIFLFYIFLYSFVENIVVRKNLNKIEMIKEKKKMILIYSKYHHFRTRYVSTMFHNSKLFTCASF